jgi:hypothetical protein
LIFGLFGGIVYHGLSTILASKIEDPADIVAVHLVELVVKKYFLLREVD